ELLKQLEAGYPRGTVTAQRVDSVARVLGDATLGQPDEKTAQALLEKIAPLAALLDQSHGGDNHSKAVDEQLAKIKDVSLTPSAKVLASMAEHKESFAQFSMRQSLAHAEFFR
ncbi:alginate biosynthesis protein AlgK, partial [Acinetobacter baumannii]|nr:alginate biosynthesis protein AlgK [Acinetobacter baumannii]